MKSEFVGRDVELQHLLDLERSLNEQGLPTVAIVSGEAGIGKSRLLAEVVARADTPNLIHLAGFDLERHLPLGAAGGLLRRLATAGKPGEQLDRLLFDPSLTVGSIQPVRLFEATHRALSVIAPVLIIVDDLQWVDDMSMALIHYVMKAAETERIPVGLIAAARSAPQAESMRQSLGQLITDPDRLQDLELGPLARDPGTRLVLLIDPDLGEPAAAAVWEEAHGSPFWIELLAGHRPDGVDVGRFVQNQSKELGSDATTVLYTLTLAGRPLPTEDVAQLLDWSKERLRKANDVLAARGLTLEADGMLRLAHDLIRDELLRLIPPARRRRLHRLLAIWLEEQSGADLQDMVEALEHLTAAGLSSTGLALKVAGSPRRRLIGTAGLQRLLAIADTSDSIPLERQVAALAAELGEHELAFTRWSALVGREDDPSDAGTAALAACTSALELGRGREARTFLERARAASDDDPAVGINIDAQQATLSRLIDRDPEASLAAAHRAVETAQALVAGPTRLTESQRHAYLRALSAGMEAALAIDEISASFAFSEETIQIAAGFDDRDHVRALAHSGFMLRLLGRNHEAAARLEWAWDEARREILPQATLEVGALLAFVLHSLGRLTDAEAVVAECAALQERLVEARPARAMTITTPHLLELSRGSWRDGVSGLAEEAAKENDPHWRLHPHLERGIALARLDPVGSASEVRQAMAAATNDAEAAGCRRCYAEVAFRSGEALARVGDVAEARRHLDRGRAAMPESDISMKWWSDRAAGCVTAAEGHEEAAADALHEVIGDARDQGKVMEALWAQLDLGTVLAPSNPSEAATVLRETGRQAEDMGALTEQGLAEQGLRRLGVRTWRRGARAAGPGALAELSPREQDIARLVTSGASNPEIAAQLFLSRKTVERHVSNILAKLGIRNRAELAGAIGRDPDADV